MIIKIQRSIVTNESTPQAVIYNESRSIFWKGPLPKDIKRMLGKRLKVYAESRIVGTEVVVDKVVQDQDW